MQPSPGRVVTAQAQLSLQPYSAGSVLLGGDCPHRPKPNRERFPSVLEDGSSCHRALIPATRTLQQHPAHWPGLPTSTPRTPKTLRPPQPYQVLSATCLCREARLKFGQISWIILHRRPYYILGPPRSFLAPSPSPASSRLSRAAGTSTREPPACGPTRITASYGKYRSQH